MFGIIDNFIILDTLLRDKDIGLPAGIFPSGKPARGEIIREIPFRSGWAKGILYIRRIAERSPTE